MDFNFCGLINCLVSFEIQCWRSMEKISWSDHVRNDEVLQRVKEERNIIQTIKEGSVTELVISFVGTAF